MKPSTFSQRANRRKFFIYSIVGWAIINAPLIIYFYDSFNVNVLIQDSFNLVLGLNPYFHGSALVSGVSLLPYDLFLYEIYNFTGFSIYATVIAAKIVAMVFTYLSFILIYRILSRFGERIARGGSLAFLFNPFILFVNDIWVQPEFFVIFLTIFALYFIMREDHFGWGTSILISIALIISSLSFYFPVFLIPIFVVYCKKFTESMKVLASTIILSLPFLILLYIYHLRTYYISSPSAYASQAGTAGIYSIFYLFSIGPTLLKAEQFGALALLLALSVTVPLILKRNNYSIEYSVVIILLSIFIMQPVGINPDTIIIVVPFIIIGATQAFRNFNYFKSLLMQIFLFSEFAIAVLFNGPGYTSGLFYWIYPFYPNHIVLADLVPHVSTVLRFLLILTLISITLTIFYLLYFRDKIRNESEAKKHQRKESKSKIPKRRLDVVVIVIFTIVLLVIASLVFSDSGPRGELYAYGDLPTQLFIPSYQNGEFIPQTRGIYMYYSSNDTLYLWNQPQGIRLGKNVTSQDFSLSGTMDVAVTSWRIGEGETIFSSSIYSAGVSQDLFVPSSFVTISPVIDENTSRTIFHSYQSLGGYIFAPPNFATYRLSNSSYIGYSDNYSSLNGKTLIFGAKLTEMAPGQNLLWHARVGNTDYESFIYDSQLWSGYFNEGQWYLSAVGIQSQLDQWFVTGITFNSNHLISFYNYDNLTLPIFSNVNSASVEINMGREQNTNSGNLSSFTGQESEPIIMSNPSLYLKCVAFVIDNGNGASSVSPISNIHSIMFKEGINRAGTYYMFISGANLSSSKLPNLIFIGILTHPFWSIEIHFFSFSIKSNIRGVDYLSLIIEDTLLFPGAVISLAIVLIKRRV